MVEKIFRIFGFILVILGLIYFGFSVDAIHEISKDTKLAKTTRHRLMGAIVASCVFDMVMAGLVITLLAQPRFTMGVAVSAAVGLLGFLAASTTVFILMSTHAKEISLSHWSLKVVRWISAGCMAISSTSFIYLGFILDVLAKSPPKGMTPPSTMPG